MNSLINEGLKDIEALEAGVAAYGQDMIALLEKKIGQEPSGDLEKLRAYYDLKLGHIRRAKKRLVGNIIAIRHVKDKASTGISLEEKWLFFHRLEALTQAMMTALSKD